jgi:hypothetical protein
MISDSVIFCFYLRDSRTLSELSVLPVSSRSSELAFAAANALQRTSFKKAAPDFAPGPLK